MSSFSCSRHRDFEIPIEKTIYRFSSSVSDTCEHARKLDKIIDRCLPGNGVNVGRIREKIFSETSDLVRKTVLPDYFTSECVHCPECKEEYAAREIKQIIDSKDKIYEDMVDKAYRNYLARGKYSNSVPRNLEELLDIDPDYYKKAHKKWKVLLSIIVIFYFYSFVLPDEEFNNIQKIMLIYLLWAIFGTHIKYVWFTLQIYFCKTVVFICDDISASYWASRYLDRINAKVTDMVLRNIKKHKSWKLFKEGVL